MPVDETEHVIGGQPLADQQHRGDDQHRRLVRRTDGEHDEEGDGGDDDRLAKLEPVERRWRKRRHT